MADLGARIGEAASVGDLALARILARALGELLGDDGTDDLGTVIDLASKRRGRS